MFCVKCGAKLDEDEKFCTVCGAKVEVETVETETVKTENVKAVTVAENSVQNPQSVQVPVNVEKNKSIGVSAIGVMVLVCLLGIAVYFGYQYFQDADDYEEDIVVDKDLFEKYDGNSLDKDDKESEKKQEETTVQEETIVQEESKAELNFPTEQIQYTGGEAIVQNLMDDNIYFNTKIYHFGNHLPTTGVSAGYNLEYVDSQYYNTYNAYVNFVHSVYVREVADEIIKLAKYFSAGNGALAYNLAWEEESSEYYVDWSVYTIEITKMESERVEFNVSAVLREPSKEPSIYTTTGVMVIESNAWKLEKEVY